VGERTEVESLRVAVLGPVRAWRGAAELALGAPQQRAVLARLAAQAGRMVSRDELIDALWGDDPPESAANGVHRYVAGLRRALEPDRGPRGEGRLLIAAPPGYLLRLPPGQVDAAVFARELGQARQARSEGRLDAAVAAFDRALSLWSGPPLSGVPGPFAEVERARLKEAYWAAVEDHAEALLIRGRAADVAADLGARVRDQPLRERLHGLLMLALYRGGRQAEALEVFRDVRRLLVEELGVEPGPELQRVHQQILTGDGTLLPAESSPAAGGARGSPAARVAPAQLPHDVGGFTGREAEIARLMALVSAPAATGQPPGPDPVLISAIDGTAGVGKTALAVHVGHRVSSSFPDGQLFLDLRGYAPHAAPMTVGEALGHLLRGLGAHPQSIPSDTGDQAGMYRTMLAGRRVLIVLDNADSAEQVRPLLPGAGPCLVLVTSRNRLDGLIARDGALWVPLDVLTPHEAMALLARFSDAAEVAAEPGAAAELTRLCGYLPLAVRIVAQRTAAHPHDTLADLAADLTVEHRRLDLLAADETTSARAAFNWSYRALPAASARAFRLLGLHPGPDVTAPAAAALLSVTPARAGALLGDLTRRHLIGEYQRGRYRFHDLIRVYAAEQAAGQPQDQQGEATDRLVRWYLHTADAADALLDPLRPRFPLGPPEPSLEPLRFGSYAEALRWCDAERDNLLAVTGLAAGTGRHGAAWRLPIALFGYFYLRKPWAAWLAATRIGLACARKAGDGLGEAATLTSLGIAHFDLRQFEAAIGHLTEALPIVRAIGHRAGEAIALTVLGGAHCDLGQHAQALGCLGAALAIWRDTGSHWGEAITLQFLGETELATHHPGQAITHLRRALRLRRDIGDQYGAAWALHDLAAAYHELGDLGTAVSHLRRVLTIRREIGDRWGEARTLRLLGETLSATGRGDEAQEALAAAAVIFRELGEPLAAGQEGRRVHGPMLSYIQDGVQT
jgi:DNA-binding SARP family transcriptional activator